MKKAELLAEQARLHALANELARKHWGVDYTGGFELVNRRWRACLGMYIVDHNVIRMSAQTNVLHSEEDVEDTLLHELVHWRLCSLDLPYHDEDYEFIAECLHVGATLSSARSAQEAYKRYVQIRAFEERTGRKFNEEDAA